MVYHPLTRQKPQDIRLETLRESSNVVNNGASFKGHGLAPLKIIAVIALLALAGTGAGIAISSLSGSNAARPDLEIVPVSINTLRLNVPQNFFRGGTAPRSGTTERIDLLVNFPDMLAAGVPPSNTRELASQDTDKLLFLTILRSDGILDPADRPQDLYGRFLEPDAWENPGGLLLRRFAKGSPYEDEELFIAPPDGKSFAARCRKPDTVRESIGEACLWRFRLNGADLQLRFSPVLLPQWQLMLGGISQLLEQWQAR